MSTTKIIYGNICFGHGMTEVYDVSAKSGWYKNELGMPIVKYPWVTRGGYNDVMNSVGIFTSSSSYGYSHYTISTRLTFTM